MVSILNGLSALDGGEAFATAGQLYKRAMTEGDPWD
jgi:hypothetical protein